MTTMLVEKYKLEPATLPSADELITAAEKRLALLDEIGFDALLEWEKKGGPRLERAKTHYPELIDLELSLWRDFLPTQYMLSRYPDTVPDDALREIQAAQQLDCFDYIEIWTPKGNTFSERAVRKLRIFGGELHRVLVDPMAVGVVRDARGHAHYHQIVRWGEALLPIDQIRQHTRRVNWLDRLVFRVLPTLVFMLGVAAYVNAISQFGYYSVIRITAMVIVLTITAVAAFRRSR